MDIPKDRINDMGLPKKGGPRGEWSSLILEPALLEADKCRCYTQSFEHSGSVVPRSKTFGGEKTRAPILMINWQTVSHACCSVVPRLRPRTRFHRSYKAGQRPSLGSVRRQVSKWPIHTSGRKDKLFLFYLINAQSLNIIMIEVPWKKHCSSEE